MKLNDIKKIHIIGIGGIGISGLARLFVHERKEVSGTNDNPSPQTLDALRELGVPISLDTDTLPEADLYVYSEAWHGMNPEFLQKAFDSGKPCMNYFEALGMVANEYYLIAISGTHGKTTTTAMLMDIFEEAELDPSGIVGSLRAKTKSNFCAGKSKYFIAEACEYKRDFLHLEPDILVITNLEYDHVDYYKDLADVESAFRELAEKVPEDGFVVGNMSSESVKQVCDGLKANTVDYSDFFNPLRELTLPGVHNQMNAAAAIAAAVQAGISTESADKALANFAGTWRRFEYKGDVNGAKVYDDYGHHPTEIEATLKATRDMFKDKKIVVAFQSHTYTRTHELFDDFVDALALADTVYVLPIYAAREENVSGVSHAKLVDAIKEKGAEAHAVETLEEATSALKDIADDDTIILTMGAGETNKVADALTS